MSKINEIPVEIEPIAIIQKRYLWRTSGEGKVLGGCDREGMPKELSFPAGAFVLSDEHGEVLCGPISRGAANILAVDIISGNSRTATRPGLPLQLATILLGMTLEPVAGPDPVAAAIETVKLFADEKEASHG